MRIIALNMSSANAAPKSKQNSLRLHYNYVHTLSQKWRKLQICAYFVAAITIMRFGGQVQLTKHNGGQVSGFRDRAQQLPRALQRGKSKPHLPPPGNPPPSPTGAWKTYHQDIELTSYIS